MRISKNAYSRPPNFFLSSHEGLIYGYWLFIRFLLSLLWEDLSYLLNYLVKQVCLTFDYSIWVYKIKAKKSVYVCSPMINTAISFVSSFNTVFLKRKTIPQLNALFSGFEGFIGQGHCSTFTYLHTTFKSTHFTP